MSDFLDKMAESSEEKRQSLTRAEKAGKIELDAKAPAIQYLKQFMETLNDQTTPDVNLRAKELESGGRELVDFICDQLDIDQKDLEAVIGS